jgi:hypothetical protein
MATQQVFADRPARRVRHAFRMPDQASSSRFTAKISKLRDEAPKN